MSPRKIGLIALALCVAGTLVGCLPVPPDESLSPLEETDSQSVEEPTQNSDDDIRVIGSGAIALDEWDNANAAVICINNEAFVVLHDELGTKEATMTSMRTESYDEECAR